jgi:hypothetical protein
MQNDKPVTTARPFTVADFGLPGMMRLASEGVATWLSYWNLVFAVERQWFRGAPRRPRR